MIPRLPFALGLLVTTAVSQTPHHAIPGVNQKGLDAKVRGLVALGELGCASCHAAGTLASRLTTRTAPDLAAVGRRLDPKYIAAFLHDPQGTKPGTTMPHVLGVLNKTDRDAAVTALTQFLVSRSTQRFTPTAPDLVAARRGRDLFHSIGCVACHAARDDKGQEITMADSVPLGRLERKYSVASLTTFLGDPLAVRRSGRMPHFKLTPRETADLANYLLESSSVSARLKYTLYLGSMHEGLKRLSGKEVRSGVVDDLDLSRFTSYHDDFAIRYEGFVRVEAAGKYTLELSCDAVGSLQIGGAPLLSIKAGGTEHATTELAAGRHAIELTYLHIRGDRKLNLSWSGPGMVRHTIPAAAFSAHKVQPQARKPLRLDRKVVELGKAFFTKLDCVRCHSMLGVGSAPPRTAMRDLDLVKGCLSKGGKGPRYALLPEQAKDIRAVLARDAVELTPEQEIQKHVVTFRCVACHQRGELGGISELRDDYFQSIGENLGPSSRIPPPLTGVGAKLQADWLANTLAHGQSIRPTMKTRMPGFGRANTARLATLFGENDKLPPVKLAPPPKDRKKAKAIRDIGSQLAGDKGMNCIACHQFAGRSSSTMISVDLVETTTQRLKKDWFYHYMINPVRFRSDTIMPLFFPGGVSTRKDIAGGDTKAQINGLWHYLAKGRNVRAPRGLSRPSMEIVVKNETVMLRRNAQNTGKRGICVGFPEKISYTFDAETLALNQIWWGKFIDPGGVWNGQGSGQVGIKERERVTLPKGPTFASLDDREAAWPTKTRRELQHEFHGYELDATRRPVFEYECEGVKIFDAPTAVRPDASGRAILRRKLTFVSDKAKTLYFRAALDKKIESVGQGVIHVGRFLELRVPPDGFLIRDTLVGDKPSKEVVMAIAIARGKTELVVDYAKREGKK
jgi:mono/diheme cytochrome c family protein